TLGHMGGGVVGAARTEGRRAQRARMRRGERTFLRLDQAQAAFDLATGVGIEREALPEAARVEQAGCDRSGDRRGRELVVGRQQPAALGHRPLAAAPVLLVELAVDPGTTPVRPVVELFLDRVLEDLALLL